MPAYLDDQDLAHFGDLKQHAPELWAAFERYYAAAFEPGLLSKREKVLIGFAVAQVSQCPYCIDSYTQLRLRLQPDARAGPGRGPARARPRFDRARRVSTGEHCFGCTAGAGSSCGGALAQVRPFRV